MMTHNDKLLELVTEQVQVDIGNGDVSSLWDMLDIIPRDRLLSYLGIRLATEAVKAGLATADEVDTDE